MVTKMLLEYEQSLMEGGAKLIGGIDEAGRGPLAGPVVVAGVIMPLEPERIIDGVNDSKKLSAKKRDKLYDEIIARAVHLGKSHLAPPLAASFYIVLYRPAAESKCNFLLKTLQKMLCKTHLTFRAETATILLYHLELYSHGKRSIPHANVL